MYYNNLFNNITQVVNVITGANKTKTPNASSTHMSEFLGTIAGDGMAMAKPFQYEVIMDFSKVASINANSKIISLLCHRAQQPGFTTMSKESKIYGLQYETAYEIAQPPLSFSFYIDRHHAVTEMLWNLRKQIMFNDTDYSPKYKTDYQFEVTLKIFGGDNSTEVLEYKLSNAFIKDVSSMELNYAPMSMIQMVNLSIVYETVTMKRVSGSSPTVTTANPYKQMTSTILPANWSLLNSFNPITTSAYNALSNYTYGTGTSNVSQGFSSSNIVTNTLSKISSIFS